MWEHICKYWVSYAMGLIAAAFGAAAQWARTKSKEQEAIKKGMIALLHNQLYQLCTFYIQREYVGVQELKNLEYIYNAYHALGGNGTGTELYERAKKLHIKED